jgi:hypothetical protein
VSHTVTLQKQCACSGASASGPRVVQTSEWVPIRDRPWEPHALRARFLFVEKACDVCDTPWGRAVDQAGAECGLK